MSSGRGLSFVSEADLEEKRQKRQEEWEKVRQPDEPLECPEEEPFDGRTLYERLQEQKDKKQEEWEEQHKFKNMIRGLDSGETDFLDLVSKQQAAVDKSRYDKECKEINEFRSAVSQLKSSIVEAKPQLSKSVQQAAGKKSQLSLIAGAIKRKSSSTSKEDTVTKKSKSENSETLSTSSRAQESRTESQTDPGSERLMGTGAEFQSGDKSEGTGEKQTSVDVTTEESAFGTVLPGVGAYSDSSDSNSSSSDSEIEIPRTVPTYRVDYM